MEKENLPDFVKRVRSEKGLSLRAVDEKSGGQISHSYVNQIENGERPVPKISVEALQGLAKGLGVSENEVFSIARGSEISEDEEIINTFELMAQKYLNAPESDKERLRSFMDMFMRELDRVESVPQNFPAFEKNRKIRESKEGASENKTKTA